VLDEDVGSGDQDGGTADQDTRRRGSLAGDADLVVADVEFGSEPDRAGYFEDAGARGVDIDAGLE
jgi:hypothetical protein